ncbi:MAG: MaoC/PaaZ C-terminal domain-containing protein [Myxococcota bacterium]|nr:MaoC/PaaZ C-terminal domain-containing protein [Myxococcota bacterium]
MTLNLETIGQPIELKPFSYSWKETALYALGVGYGRDSLDYVWEGSEHFKVLPSFAVIPTQPIVMKALAAVNANMKTLVHGAQTIKLHAPIPKEGTFHSMGRVTEVQDKGKGAVVIIETETRSAAGEHLFDTSWSIFCRGQGGFGGERGQSIPLPDQMDGPPVFERCYSTTPSQALLYRLSGDLNPLHVDPNLAQKVGFKEPILHGLCTYGVAVRAILDSLCAGDKKAIKSFTARFSQVVFPGDELDVRIYDSVDDNVYRLEVLVGETAVLSHGVVELG